MKFEEAFEEMQKGKICEVDNTKYRINESKLEFYQTSAKCWVVEWINDTMVKLINMDWKVVDEDKDWNGAKEKGYPEWFKSSDTYVIPLWAYRKTRDLIIEDLNQECQEKTFNDRQRDLIINHIINKRFGDLK